MNREIKFTGRRVDCVMSGEKLWVFGHYVKQKEKHFIVDKNGKYNEVDPITIGQYTGIKDAKGIELYENNVVKIKGEYLGFEHGIELSFICKYIPYIGFVFEGISRPKYFRCYGETIFLSNIILDKIEIEIIE